MDLARKPHFRLRSEEPCSFPIEEENEQYIASNNQYDFRNSIESQLVLKFFTLQHVMRTRDPCQDVKGGELQHTHHEEEPNNFSTSSSGPRNGESATDKGSANQVQYRLRFETHAGADQNQRCEETEDTGEEEDRRGKQIGRGAG